MMMLNERLTLAVDYIDRTRGLKECVAGTSAGIAGTSIGHPLDTLKVFWVPICYCSFYILLKKHITLKCWSIIFSQMLGN